MGILFIVIAGTLVLIGLVAYRLISKQKKDAWTGELVDKQIETSSSGDYDSTHYVLVVNTTDGLQKRSYVRKKFYEQVTVGDKLQKNKGETYPRKL